MPSTAKTRDVEYPEEAHRARVRNGAVRRSFPRRNSYQNFHQRLGRVTRLPV
jgi:hypothetical protein